MSPPSHILAPLIGSVTTCAAVVALGLLTAPLLPAPRPDEGRLPDSRATLTLAPDAAERVRAPGSGGGDPAGAAALVRLQAGVPGAAPTVSGPFALGPTTTATIGPSAPDGTDGTDGTDGGSSDGLREGGPASDEGAVRGEDGGVAVVGGNPISSREVGSAPASLAPVAPAADPTTIPAAADETGRFVLRVVGLDLVGTADQREVRVRVAIAPIGDRPADEITVTLRPSSIRNADGQALRVILDIVPGAAPGDEPKLRVRVELVTDDTGGAPTAVQTGDDAPTSNTVEVNVPVTVTGEGASGTPAPGEPAAPATELLLSFGPVDASAPSAGSASTAPGPDPGTTAPSGSVDVRVERAPETDPPAAIAPEPEAPAPAPEPEPVPVATPTPTPEPEPAVTPQPESSVAPSTPPAPPSAPEVVAAPAPTPPAAPAPVEPTVADTAPAGASPGEFAPAPRASEPDAVVVAPTPDPAPIAEPTPAEPVVAPAPPTGDVAAAPAADAAAELPGS